MNLDIDVKNVLVTGHGRSGTNWLLGMFDHSDRTFCRNEPNEIVDSPFVKVGCGWVRGTADKALEQYWDNAIARATERQGHRDQDLPTDKMYLHRCWRLRDRVTFARRGRLRRSLGLLIPEIARNEWRLPFCIGSRRALEKALPVLKMLMIPGWSRWVLANRQQTLVVHIVRHPGGFMNSWLNRYVAGKNPNDVLKANLDRLHQVAAVEAKWAEMFGVIDAMSFEESELWYWAYATDLIHSTGEGRDNYRLIIYENLADRELETARSLYEAAGLPWTKTVEQKIQVHSMMKKNARDAWRQHASEKQCQLIDRILSERDLDRFWD